MLEACQRATRLKPNEARSLLGKFLFSGEEAEKPVDGLSGGERRRLSLAVLVQSGSNVLILDEPTNHLDLESREALESALQAFPGALLLISHDRALLDAVGTRTIAIEDQTLHSYVGGWPEYVRVREERAELEREAKRAKPPAAPKPKQPVPATPKPTKAQEKQARQLEAEIEAAETELARLEEELADPAAWNDPRSAREVDAQARRGEGARRAALRAARSRGRIGDFRSAGPCAQRCARLIDIPSSTFATVSQASTDSSSVSKMSFQRISIIGSMPFANSDATAARTSRSPSFSSRWISTRCGARSAPLRSPRSAAATCSEHATSTSASCERLLHRRLDAVEDELVGGLLGVVDDVVERARERVHVGRVERRAAPVPVARQAVQDVVGDAVALLLAEQDVAGERGLLGVVREQVAEQQRAALDVARGLLEEPEQLGVRLRLRWPHAART